MSLQAGSPRASAAGQSPAELPHSEDSLPCQCLLWLVRSPVSSDFRHLPAGGRWSSPGGSTVCGSQQPPPRSVVGGEASPGHSPWTLTHPLPSLLYWSLAQAAGVTAAAVCWGGGMVRRPAVPCRLSFPACCVVTLARADQLETLQLPHGEQDGILQGAPALPSPKSPPCSSFGGHGPVHLISWAPGSLPAMPC